MQLVEYPAGQCRAPGTCLQAEAEGCPGQRIEVDRRPRTGRSQSRSVDMPVIHVCAEAGKGQIVREDVG